MLMREECKRRFEPVIAAIDSLLKEKENGTGYYRGLKGEGIPFGGRILAVSDVFDAITSKRHYRDKMPIKNVLGIMSDGAGSHFDPEIVDKFLQIPLDKILNVLLSDSSIVLSDQDAKLTEKCNLSDIKKYSETSEITDNEQQILDLFNYYYLNQQGEQ